MPQLIQGCITGSWIRQTSISYRVAAGLELLLSCLWPIIRVTGKWATVQAVNLTTLRATIRINHSTYNETQAFIQKANETQMGQYERTGETGQNWTNQSKVTVETHIQT